MKINYINKDLFFSSKNPFPDFQNNKKNSKRPMLEIINRYDIKNKKILSIGSGNAFEEYYFTEFNNFVSLSDADLPYGSITPWIKKCRVEYNSKLIYDVEDWEKIPKKYKNKPTFDVIYISSLHPDELYRGRVQYNWVKNNLLKTLVSLKTWPKKNFYSKQMELLLPLLKNNGLLIIQHYGYSVPLVLNIDLVKIWEKQFNPHSVKHIETWCFKKYTGNMLNVFLKANSQYRKEYIKKINERPGLTQINGRFLSKSKKKLKIFKPFFEGEIIFKPNLLNKFIPLIHQIYRSFRFSIKD